MSSSTDAGPFEAGRPSPEAAVPTVVVGGAIDPNSIPTLGAPPSIGHCPACARYFEVRHWVAEAHVACPSCGGLLTRFRVDATIEARVPPRSESAPAPAGRPFGRYRILEELGRGGMGVVWKAWDTELSREVALKQVLGEVDPHRVERFMREARVAAKLRHPSIVSVHDVGVHEGHHYFTTDYIQARTLADVMRGAVPARQALAWVKSVAEALAYAHEHGVVHRDVKPGNILIDAEGRPYVMDFGLAREVELGTDGGRRLTLSGDLMGTPAYMSPEQARGLTSEVGAASDQFSLGGVLYELVTGRTPFNGAGLSELLNEVIERDPVRPAALNPRLHRDVETVILKALEKRPERRYASMGEFAADLGRCLEGEPIHARSVTWLERGWRRVRRNPVISMLAMGLTIAAMTLGGLAWRAVAERREKVRLQEESQERARALERAERDRVVQAILRPLARKIEECRLYFYIEHVDIRRKLDEIETLLRELEALLEKPEYAGTSEAWTLLGIGWYSVGWDERAERALLRAQELDPDDGRNAFYLGRMYASRSIYTLMNTPNFEEGVKVAEQWSQKALIQLQKPMPGLEEIDHHLVVTLRAVSRGDAPEARRLSQEGLERFKGQLGVEYYWIFLGCAQFERDEYLAMSRTWRKGGALTPQILRVWKTQLDAWSKVLEFRPHYDRAYLVRAFLYLQSGLTTNAIAELDKAIHLNPYLCEAWSMRAEVYYKLRQYEKAIADYGEALKRNPEDAAVYNDRGNTHWSLGQAARARGVDPRGSYEKAIADYSEALKRDPDYALAYENRGNAHSWLGRAAGVRGVDPRESYKMAIADYEEALKRNPDDAVAHNSRGSAYLLLGQAEGTRGVDPRENYEKAIASYGEALKRNPDAALAHNGRGNAYDSLGQAERERGIDPRASYERAIVDYGEALKRKPQDAVIHKNRGYTFWKLGEAERALGLDARETYEKSISDCSEALRLRPGDTELEDLIARARARLTALVERPAWAALERATQAMQGSDYAAARAGYEEGLSAAAEVERTDTPSPALRVGLSLAHYNLSRIRSLLSAGRDSPTAEPRAVSEEESAEHRSAAFAHLSRAVALGWKDAEALASESDLLPLHDDARWAETLRRLGAARQK